MILFIILTALTVSIDSLVGGFSLSIKAKNRLPIVIGIAVIVFIMCAITNYGAMVLNKILNEKTASFSGLILIGVGLYNLFKKSKEQQKERTLFLQTVIIGFAVGIDGALANLSLSLMGLNAFYVPIIIAVMHALMIALGSILSQTSFVKKFAKIEFIPPLILIILGAYKLLGLLI